MYVADLGTCTGVDVHVIKPLEPLRIISMDSSSSIHVPVDTIDEKLLTEAMNHLCTTAQLCVLKGLTSFFNADPTSHPYIYTCLFSSPGLPAPPSCHPLNKYYPP